MHWDWFSEQGLNAPKRLRTPTLTQTNSQLTQISIDKFTMVQKRQVTFVYINVHDVYIKRYTKYNGKSSWHRWNSSLNKFIVTLNFPLLAMKIFLKICSQNFVEKCNKLSWLVRKLSQQVSCSKFHSARI